MVAIAQRRAYGAEGEGAVAAWYEARGYEVLDRNWRCPAGELDLVVRHRRSGVIVFCEVKTRSSDRFGSALEAVRPPKAARVRRLGLRWLEASGKRPPDVRFDVAAVQAGVIDVVEGAL